MFKAIVRLPARAFTSARVAVASVAAFCAAALIVAFPVAALATESETEKKIGTVTTQVSTEGVSIVIAVLGGLAALIAAIIIIPKAIGMIKRFI